MKPEFYVDFNEMVESDLVLLSSVDVKRTSDDADIELREGMEIIIYMDDFTDDGRRDNLVAEGVVERNHSSDWSAHVKWCCRIDLNGIRHQSEC